MRDANLKNSKVRLLAGYGNPVRNCLQPRQMPLRLLSTSPYEEGIETVVFLVAAFLVAVFIEHIPL